jgi:hypothetical protein
MLISLTMKACAGTVVLTALLLASGQNARADESEGTAKPEPMDKQRRRVYVLHSGLHTLLSDPAKNIAAQTLKEGLRKRGVPERDLVVLDNPYPNASWMNFVPLESIAMFFDSIEPSSKMSHESYLRMHKALEARGVSATDDVVWIGHSAGGQIGLTMANLAGNLSLYPDLEKKARPYHFDMVITLGAPVGSTLLPPGVKLRCYYSADDKVIRWASRIGSWMAWPLGYRARVDKLPSPISANCLIRCFGNIEHPYWDVDERVLDRILGETTSDFRPFWRSQVGVARWGVSLSELLSRALESECHISIEDPPKAVARTNAEARMTKE